jgi:trehalose-phosphatase
VTEAPLDHGLRAALAEVAAAGRLLVACDVDGTLAPIVDDPAAAAPRPDSLAALAGLARLPGTTVALVSGRRLAELRTMTGLGPPVVLVGSHGAEHGTDLELTPEAARLLEHVVRDVHWVTHGVHGVQVEVKAGSVAVHVRRATHLDAHRVVADTLAGPGARPGVRTTLGKKVVELSVVDVDKGRALDRLRDEARADAVVFLGDDTTDEHAFALLRPGDVGVKVGDGDSLARFRIGDTADVAAALELLLAERTASIPGHDDEPG